MCFHPLQPTATLCITGNLKCLRIRTCDAYIGNVHIRDGDAVDLKGAIVKSTFHDDFVVGPRKDRGRPGERYGTRQHAFADYFGIGHCYTGSGVSCIYVIAKAVTGNGGSPYTPINRGDHHIGYQGDIDAIADLEGLDRTNCLVAASQTYRMGCIISIT